MHFDRASRTAILIARCLLLARQDPKYRSLVPPGVEAPLTALLASDSAWFNRAVKYRWMRKIFLTLERFLLPGIITHYLVRKSWIEDATREAINRGTDQVVVIGAGYDTLAWRLRQELPRVGFFEMDHPATQAAKTRSLPASANLTCLPLNLATDSPVAVLTACPGFSMDRSTLIIAEGLFMYFPETQVASLLSELTRLTRRKTEILFTCMELPASGPVAFPSAHGAVGWWMRRCNEPFQWGIAPAALPAFLQKRGLKITALADHHELRTKILVPLDLASLALARGEFLCLSTTFSP